MTEVMDRHYASLIRRFPLRRLRSDADLDAAHQVLRKLMLRGPDLSGGEAAYLEVLSMIVHEYESAHHPFSFERSVRELLRYLVKESGMSVSELGRIVGSQPEASMLLSGAREPSKEQVVRLASHFKVRAELFLPRMRRQKKSA